MTVHTHMTLIEYLPCVMCKSTAEEMGRGGQVHSTMLITVSASVCPLPWLTKQSIEPLFIISAFFAGPSLQLHYVTVNIPEPGWHRLPHGDVPAKVDWSGNHFPKLDQHLLTPLMMEAHRIPQLTQACVTVPEHKLQQNSDTSVAISPPSS